MSNTPSKVGQFVKWNTPVEGDADLYKVLQIEPETNWCLIEAQLKFKSQDVANISDLHVYEGPIVLCMSEGLTEW